jgi:hypothetical protein
VVLVARENKELEAELYRLSYSAYGGAKIRIKEYAIVNETAKSYMCLPLVEDEYKWSKKDTDAFPKEQEGKVQFDVVNGRLHNATLFMTEVSREEVEMFGVNLMKEKVSEWLQLRADYYTRRVKELENPTIE